MKNRNTTANINTILYSLILTINIQSQTLFTDATSTAVGMPRHSIIAIADVDGDNVEELIVSALNQATSASESQIWKHVSNLNYTNATSTSGLQGIEIASCGDFNHDGSIDFLHVNGARTEAALYINSGGGTFTKHLISGTESAAIRANQDGVRAVDIDNDGDLDLVFGQPRGSGGSIVAVINQSKNGGPNHQPFSGVTILAVTSWIHNKADVTDANGDGKADLLSIRTAGNWSSGTHPDFPVTLFINSGNAPSDYLNPDGTRDLAGFVRVDDCGISAANVMSPLASWDVDNDGDLDLINGSSDWPWTSRPHIYINDGVGNYSQMNSPVYQSTRYYHHWISLFDADLDNDMDAVWTGLHNFADIYPRMWRNDGNLSFSDVTSDWGIAARYAGSANLGMSGYHADLDRDGDLDFVCDIGTGPIYRIYQNQSVQRGANWLGIQLVSANSAPNGVGAKVEVTSNGKKLTQYMSDITGGVRNLSGLRFGLGAATSASSVKVFWPAGTVSQLTQITGNKILTISEQSQLSDTTPPNITLIGDNPLTIYRGQTFTDPGATVTDNVDAERTIVGEGVVDTLTLGTYTLTYSASDAMGNAAETATRTVHVVLDPIGDDDGDGLSNQQETDLGTNPLAKDSDQDGVNDPLELADGTDPTNAESFNTFNRGLLAYYPFNDHYDDLSGNGRHLTIRSGASLVNGPSGSGNALRLSPSSYAETEVHAGISQNASRTISFWFHSDGPQPHPQGYAVALGNYGDHHNGNKCSISIDSSKNNGIIFVDNDFRNVWSDEVPQLHQRWHHVVWTYQDNLAGSKIYIDGQLFPSTPEQDGTTVLKTPEGPLTLGRPNGIGFQGELDNVRIYDRALSLGEVHDLYQSEIGDLDTTPPTITLIGDNPLTIYRGQTFTDPGATVTDNVDAERTIEGEGVVDVSTVGTYTLTYAATDAMENAAESVTREVYVIPGPLPVIESFATDSEIITLGSAATLGWSTSDAAVLSIDNGVGDVTGSSSISVSPTQTTTYTLTATGISGDVATASVTIKVRKPRFMVVHGSYTWHQAKADADARGGRLAVLDTQEKLDQAKAIAISNDSYLWIGLTDEVIEGQWRWIDGSPLTVSSWHPGEPNNSGNEDYAHFYASSPYWNDIHDWSFRYLLEYPYPKIKHSAVTHGSIDGAGEYTPGSVVMLTATPDAGYLFAGWTGDAEGDSNPLTLEIENDLTIGATFVPDLSDVDADGLSAFEELTIHGTDPTLADTDGDGLTDGVETGNSRYEIILENRTWEQAKLDAINRGGRLAVLDSQRKIDALRELVAAGTYPGSYHIGLEDPSLSGNWRWINGQPLSVSHWAPNEPQNYQGRGETVAAMIPAHDAKWADIRHDDVYDGYVLETNYGIGTNPLAKDTDGDGFEDKTETEANTDPNNPSDYPDDTPPTITLIGDNPLTIYRGQTFTDPGATVTDNVEAERTIVGVGAVDTATLGTYTLTYAASDAMGNAAETVTRSIIVTIDFLGDPDGDGLNNSKELELGTDLYDPDSDNDLFGDAYEVNLGTNPLDHTSYPQSRFDFRTVVNPASYGDITPAKELQIEGNTLAVWDSTGNGNIHLFDFSNELPVLKSTIQAPHSSYDWLAFGYSISINGDRLLTGDLLTWLSGIHDGRAYAYNIQKLSNPVLQHTLARDAQTATYIGLRVLAVNGFSVVSSQGNQSYGTPNRVHVFRENGEHYTTITDGFNKGIEFARDDSRNSFAVIRTKDFISDVIVYDIKSGEVVERDHPILQITNIDSNEINQGGNQFGHHRFILDGETIYFIDGGRMRIFEFSGGQWNETVYDLDQYISGNAFQSTNLLLTQNQLFVASPVSSAVQGRQGCVVVFDRGDDGKSVRFREVLTLPDTITGGRFGSYLAFNELTQRLLVSSEYGSSHAWGVVNTNNGKWFVFQYNGKVNLQVQPSAHGVISGAGEYEPGSMATVSAVPNPGCVFVGWEGDLSGSENPIRVVLDSDKVISAIFTPDLSDSDLDGLTHFDEITVHGTNPDLADTDGDGFNDMAEINSGTDPLDADSRPTPPTISVFSANLLQIMPGGSAILSWTATAGAQLMLDPEIGAVTGTQGITVQPSQTTTYTLTATNLAGQSVTTSLTVEVMPPFSQDFLWARGWGGTGNDGVQAVATDSLGRVLLAADFSGTLPTGVSSLSSAGSSDLALLRLASDGTVLGAQRFGGANADIMKAMAVDASNQVILAAEFFTSTQLGTTTHTSAGSRDGLLIKLNADGTVQWSRRLGGTQADSIHAVSVDAAGNVFIVGDFNGAMTLGTTTLTSRGGRDGYLAKLTPQGNFVWAVQLGGTGNDESYALAIDPDGNIAVVGQFFGNATFGASSLTSAGGTDGFVCSLDANGGVRWVHRFGGASNDRARAVVMDASGALAIAGTFASSDVFVGGQNLYNAGADDGFLLRLSRADGAVIGVTTFGGGSADSVSGLAADALGGIYLSGSFGGTAYFGGDSLDTPLGSDAYLAKLRLDGQFEWVKSATGASEESIRAIAVDSRGDVFVGGVFSSSAEVGAHAVTGGGVLDFFAAKVHGPTPSFTASAASVVVDEGSPITLTMPTVGADPMSYQWHFNGVAILGATEATLEIQSSSPSDGGDYHLVATNAYGSLASPTLNVSVVIAAQRIELEAPAPTTAENRTLSLPLYLESNGDITGLGIEIAYHPAFLSQVSFTPSSDLAGNRSTVTIDPITSTVRLTGNVFPDSIASGKRLLGTLTATVRSVPDGASIDLAPTLRSLSDVFGSPITSYTKVSGTSISVARRDIPGDSNNNGRLDVSDAAEILRLYANPSLIRSWDHLLNDLNGDGLLTEGDATRVHRVITRLDAIPDFGGSGTRSTTTRIDKKALKGGSTISTAELKLPGIQPAGLGPAARMVLTRLTGANANKVLAQVFLDDVPAGQAGLGFSINYPADVLRIAGASSLIIPAGGLPANAAPVWNVLPGNQYANQSGTVIMSAAWGSGWTFPTNQSVANLVFEVNPAALSQVNFPLTLGAAESAPYNSDGPSTPLALNGTVSTFTRSYADWAAATLGDANASMTADSDGDGMSNAAEYAASTDPTDAGSALRTTDSGLDANGFTLRWHAAYGVRYRVTASTDLQQWAELTGSQMTGIGEETHYTDPIIDQPGKFYRVEVLEP